MAVKEPTAALSPSKSPQLSTSSASAPSSSTQDESKQKTNLRADEMSVVRFDPTKDPSIKYSSILTNDASRCRHLEECMFPRFLSLDGKQMDDFCMGCVKDRPSMKNIGRIYIEALHLKDFLKSPEDIISQRNTSAKGSGKRGRNNNAESSSKKKNHSSPSKRGKEKSDEKVTDNKLLSQSYFGGLEGKRTWFLTNSNQVGKGGGIAGTFCKILPSSALIVTRTGEDSKLLKATAKKSQKGLSPSDEALNNMLSSEIKLTSLRKAMRLYDQTIPEDANLELTRLENLVKPLPGYTHPSPSDSKKASHRTDGMQKDGSELSNDEPMAVTPAAADTPTSSPDVGSQSMDIDIKGKKNDSDGIKSDKMIIPGPTTPSNDNAPVTPVPSNDTLLKEGSPSMKSPELKSMDVLSLNERFAKLEDTLKESCHRPKSNFERTMHEGKEAALAANMLLESFGRNRRKFWAQKLKNGKPPKCAWCPDASCSASSRAKNSSSFEFGVIKDNIALSKVDEDDSGVHCGATGDALIQCLECDLVGCAPILTNREKSGNQHAMLHFLMSGHRFGEYVCHFFATQIVIISPQ